MIEKRRKHMYTKGEMIKALKAKGVRKGETESGSVVCLKQLKTYQISKLYDQYVTEEE
jgi:hypothetical protein